MTLTRYAPVAVVLALIGLTGAASSESNPPSQSPPIATSAPTISGTPQVGLKLTGTPGKFTGTGRDIVARYQPGYVVAVAAGWGVSVGRAGRRTRGLLAAR